VPRFATANCRKKLVKARLRDCIFAFAALVGISSGSTQAAERVFVAGGSGRSGIEIVRVLAKSGYIVMASTRDAKRARERFGSDITWVEVDLLDPLAAREAVRGADIVVSALGHGDMVGVDSPQIVHDLAIRSLIDAAKTAGVKHMVLMSSSTAGHALDHRLEPRFGFVLHWMTKSEDYLISSGLPYTIIGPGGLVEGESEKIGARMIPRSEYKRALVSRASVAYAVALAISDPLARGKAIALVADSTAKPGKIMGRYADIPMEVAPRGPATR
jgi:uncharacterized protein YbjT (DUF2867 family)